MRKIIYPMVIFVILLTVWELLVVSFEIPEYILPLPSAVFYTLWNSFDMMASHLFVTFLEAVLGFLLAAFLGISLGVIFDLSGAIKASFYPYVIVIRIAPVIAIAPFLILWFGNGMISKVITATIMSIFFIIVNFTKGLQEVSQESLDLMTSLSSTKWQVLKKLKLPNSVPYLFAGLKMAVATSIAGAVVAEFVGANKGLGFLIVTNFYYLKTSMMFAALLLLFLVGIFFFGIVSLVEELFFSKYSIMKS